MPKKPSKKEEERLRKEEEARLAALLEEERLEQERLQREEEEKVCYFACARQRAVLMISLLRPNSHIRTLILRILAAPGGGEAAMARNRKRPHGSREGGQCLIFLLLHFCIRNVIDVSGLAGVRAVIGTACETARGRGDQRQEKGGMGEFHCLHTLA